MKKLILFTVCIIFTYIGNSFFKKVKEKSCHCEEIKLKGISSYYSDKFDGRKTANGETFRQDSLTAACNILPLGTLIKVINTETGDSVFLKVNDRMDKRNKRLLDLSKEAANRLNFIETGLAKVEVVVLDSCAIISK